MSDQSGGVRVGSGSSGNGRGGAWVVESGLRFAAVDAWCFKSLKKQKSNKLGEGGFLLVSHRWEVEQVGASPCLVLSSAAIWFRRQQGARPPLPFCFSGISKWCLEWGKSFAQ